VPNDNTFVKISNEQIYEKICKIEEVINGNGKKGLKEQISSNSINIRIQYGLLILVVGAILKGILF